VRIPVLRLKKQEGNKLMHPKTLRQPRALVHQNLEDVRPLRARYNKGIGNPIRRREIDAIEKANRIVRIFARAIVIEFPRAGGPHSCQANISCCK
jgi:hypothetical protein